MERIVMAGTPLTLEERLERQANEIRTKERQIEQLKAENDHWQEVCADLHKEIWEARQDGDSQQRIAIREMEKVKALTADKDEQAGRIMQMDGENKKLREGLRHAKADLQVAQNFSHPNGFKTIRKAINSIDALLGGEEDG